MDQLEGIRKIAGAIGVPDSEARFGILRILNTEHPKDPANIKAIADHYSNAENFRKAK